MDDFFQDFIAVTRRPGVHDIPIAPIIDMLVAIIFFLLLSTTFVELSKQTVPPARLSTITNPVAPPPLAPKLFALRTSTGLRLVLRWSGDKPGQAVRNVALSEPSIFSEALVAETKKLIGAFTRKYPQAATLQIGFTQNIVYQEVISVMDGVLAFIPDLVLVSYDDAAAVKFGS